MALHRMGDFLRNVASNVIPQSNESKFLTHGQLTPDEFVRAGDALVAKFPAWQWVSDSKGEVSYLPKGKQFLITRNVACTSRVRDLDYTLTHNTRDDGEWVIPGDDAEEDIPTIQATSAPLVEPARPTAEVDDEDLPVIGSQPAPVFKEVNLDDDESDTDSNDGIVIGGTSGIVEASGQTPASVERLYDLTITYDKYYQTPRLWLHGFHSDGRPLAPQAVYEDVLSEYATKTVTIDPHPATKVPSASIHPCRHAEVMLKFVQGLVAQNKPAKVDDALFVFLKFMSSVIPTIDYDCTMDVGGM